MGRRTKEQTKVDETIIRQNAGGEGNETKLAFATRLNDLIDKQGLRQSDLSELSGIATGTISGYRNGEKEPTITNLRKIAQALDVSADYLLGLSDVQSADIDTQDICKKIGCSEKSLENLMRLYTGEVNLSGTIFKINKQRRVPAKFLNCFFSCRELEHFLIMLMRAVHAKNEADILNENAQNISEDLSNIEMRLAQEVDADVVAGKLDPDADEDYILEQRCKQDAAYSNLLCKVGPAFADAELSREKSDAILWRSQHDFWKFIELLAKGAQEDVQTKQ